MTVTHERRDTHPLTPERLLDSYVAGDFFFATRQHTILGIGRREVLTAVDPARLADTVAAELTDLGAPLAVGVLPFDTTASGTSPTRIVVPRDVRIAGPAHPAAATLTRRTVGVPIGVRAVPHPARHEEAVARALTELRHRDLRKVVLARALDVEFADPVPAEAVLRNLVRDNPEGYTYAAGLPAGRVLVGATPELLISRRGTRVFAHPHGGSAPRSADPATDAANAEALLASEKDHAEHAVLREAVLEALRPLCRSLTAPDTPSLAATPTMWHLGTTIAGELVDPDISALRLAAELHPTPAICGTPTDTARGLARRLEPFDRGYYAGAVGWVDAAGDGEWAVAIRCAEVADHSLRMYAGGGIVAASEPAAELAETSAKFQTLLRAMGLDLDF
ncbi:isochorismate synthase [Amycolatopsis arida]|uniref:isochorismate synthase n=1 Tax=Amycolatopsis arida TaxID=587909 RepID=A0A1I5QGD9_9PSEU|nr:isochorismate synthase [Amycolatopsis arida]TDX98829.1 isochorismate synthase [Amycolatopsis arida]SFP45197.1 isochorismate synthase [Amycolatopsis arida]